MAGRDERRGWDLDDWFDEPQPSITPRVRPTQSPAQLDDVGETQHADDEDWLGSDERSARGPRSGFPGALSEPRLALVVVALVVALAVSLALALSGVFSSSTPRRVATTTLPTPAKTTTTATPPAQPQPRLAAVPRGPLKPGDQGSAVNVLQRALASLGYSPGAIDGNYGTSTQRAVARFQSFSNLTPDGILGPHTLRALDTALKGP